jgi:hypothetical protein
MSTLNLTSGTRGGSCCVAIVPKGRRKKDWQRLMNQSNDETLTAQGVRKGSGYCWCNVDTRAGPGSESRISGPRDVSKHLRARHVSLLVSLVPPPFPPTSAPSLLSDRRLSSNRTLGSPSSSADSQARIASCRSSPIWLVASPTARRQLGSLRNSIASLERAMLYIGRFRTFSMSPFHLRRPFSPFYIFIFTLDVAFDYRQTLLRPRRFRARRREPHDHLIIFLCLRTWSTTSYSLSPAVPYPSSFPFLPPLAHLRS